MESDLINIEELKSLYGDDSVKELLEMSLNEGRALIEALKENVPKQNGAQVAADAHQLKGMSATMTMNRVSELAYKLELCGKSQTWQESDVVLKDIDKLFKELEEYLQKVLA